MLVKLHSAAVWGMNATPVTIEVNVTRGTRFALVGLPDSAVRESHERVVAAIENSGYNFPMKQVVINLAPADIRKEGSSYDLPMAIGVLGTENILPATKFDDYIMLGELSLDGSVLPVRGALPIAILAKELGYKGLIVPEENAREAAVVDNIKVYGVRHLNQVVSHLNGSYQLEPTVVDMNAVFYDQQSDFDADFFNVKGQEQVKRAIEVAAAGGHNLIMVGPPGGGKSMMAQCIPSILPPLSLKESIETTKIHSIAGRLPAQCSLITQRPFRSPHHTISQVALVGGGQNPQPGEISLAHNGVLFCDELPEFNRNTLEVLRQPLEDRKIDINRAKYSVNFPCSFMFVASMNPCPCGYYNHPEKRCTCTPTQRLLYLNRISGPLLDRIDIHCEIQPVGYSELISSAPNERSETIRKRVIEARKIQEKRYANEEHIHCNAQMSQKHLKTYCELSAEAGKILQRAMEHQHLSARAYSRILKVARTIADLDGNPQIEPAHIAEAVSYRSLDRNNWGE